MLRYTKYATRLSDVMDLDDKHSDAIFCSSKHFWSVDGFKQEIVLPQKFRIIDDHKTVPVPFSASGIFNEDQLINTIDKIKTQYTYVKRIFVVDLLQEYHFFFDGLPVTVRGEHNFANVGVDAADVQSYEKKLLDKVKKYVSENGIVIATHYDAADSTVAKINQMINLLPHKIDTESSLVNFAGKAYNLNQHDEDKVELLYKRFPVTDHSKPTTQVVESFFNFVTNEFNPETDWVHIHCHGGKGRSSTFSLFFDVLMRLKSQDTGQINLENIMKTHQQLGAKDLKSAAKKDSWKKDLAEQRYDYIEEQCKEFGEKFAHDAAEKSLFEQECMEFLHEIQDGIETPASEMYEVFM